jgi:hypothetical protein
LKGIKVTAAETVSSVASQLPEIRRTIAQLRTQAVTISALDDVLAGVKELGYPKIGEKLLELAGGVLGIDSTTGLGSQAKSAERRALEIEQAIRPLFQQLDGGEMLRSRLEASAIRGTLPYLP